MMFQSYSNTPEYFLRDYVAKAMMITLFTCLRAKAQSFTGVHIIKKLLRFSITGGL